MTVSKTDTKDVILKAYVTLEKEHKQLQKDYAALQKSAAAGSAAPARAAAPSTGAPNDIGGIISGLQGLRASLAASVATLQEQLTAEAVRLSGLREQADGIVGELQGLHGITPSEGKLGELLAQYKEKAQANEEERSTKERAHDEDMAARHTAWDKEQEEHRRQLRERDEELKKSRKREAEEYKYDLDLRRKLDEDSYAQGQKKFVADLDELKAVRERDWQLREEAVAVREKEYNELKTKVQKHPEELDKATKQAREEGVGIAKRQARIEADLITKENEGKQRVYELRVKSLEESIAKNAALLTDLSDQLRTAQRQAQELAVKAIEGSSNERSFQSIREIAIEQAKNASKNK